MFTGTEITSLPVFNTKGQRSNSLDIKILQKMMHSQQQHRKISMTCPNKLKCVIN